jgi:phosphopantetheinyl transferase
MAIVRLSENSRLGIWKIEESSYELSSFLFNPDYYAEQIAEKRMEKRKQEWLSCRVMLERMVGRFVPVLYNGNGAPYVEGEKINISFSHTTGFAAVLIGDDSENVGIDIEKRSSRVLKVKHKFLSEDELSFIDTEKESDHLMICWCAKEALFKMMGEDGVDFVKYMHIKPFECEERGIITAYETKTYLQRSFQLRYELTEDYALVYSNNQVTI